MSSNKYVSDYMKLNDHELENMVKELRKKDDYDGDGTRGPDVRSSRGFALRTRRILPPQGPLKAFVLYCHGAGAHCHRRMDRDFAKKLNDNGVGWFGYDAESHGLSEGNCFIDIPTHVEMVNDAERYLQMITKEFPGVPYFLFGDSMGGGIALLLGTKIQEQQQQQHGEAKGNDQQVDYSYLKDFMGVGALAPGIHNSIEPPALVTWFMTKFIINRWPTSRVPRFVRKLTPDMLFRTDEAMAEAAKDPIHDFRSFRYSTGNNLLQTTHAVQHAIPSIRFPFIVFHGTGDKVVPISGSRLLFEKSATAPSDKFIKEYKDACHEVMDDPVQAEVEHDALNFINDHLNKRDANAVASKL